MFIGYWCKFFVTTEILVFDFEFFIGVNLAPLEFMSFLFQELENTLICRWHHVSILPLQIPSFMIDEKTEPQVFA